jgi:hypothetical protein
MKESNTLNWVERHARRENVLRTQAGELWNDIRRAIQDACDSFNRLYPEGNHQLVKYVLENGHRIVVSRTIPPQYPPAQGPQTLRVVVDYNARAASVDVAYDSPHGNQTFKITCDDNGKVSIQDGSKAGITADRVSELALKVLFFAPAPFADDNSEDS